MLSYQSLKYHEASTVATSNSYRIESHGASADMGKRQSVVNMWHIVHHGVQATMQANVQMIKRHIMDSHGLCNWYSQPTLRVLHNSYSSRCWPTLRFFLIWYISQRSARPVIRVHEMDHPAVCDMMSRQLSFLLRILYHWKAVICSFLTIDHIYL